MQKIPENLSNQVLLVLLRVTLQFSFFKVKHILSKKWDYVVHGSFPRPAQAGRGSG
jgi:hypothetical protein